LNYSQSKPILTYACCCSCCYIHDEPSLSIWLDMLWVFLCRCCHI